MKRLWPGWLLCVLTAGLFAYMFFVDVPAISAMLGGIALPDAVVLGYGDAEARALYDAFAADFTAAGTQGRQSASAAYLAMHARVDLLLPPLLAMSLAFCGFASLHAGQNKTQTPRAISVGVGLVMALAFTYLACDFIENAVADAMFGPQALTSGFNGQLVIVLKVLTMGKFATLFMAVGLIAALWIARFNRARRSDAPGV